MTRFRVALAAALLLTGGWGGALLSAGPALDATSPEVRLAGAGVHLVGHRLCHQRADRSFTWRGRPLPVCGRCTGLYLAAPFGVLVAAGTRGRLRVGRREGRRTWPARTLLLWAAVPTLVSLFVEFVAGLPVGSALRAAAAAPLGAAVAWIAAAWLAGDLPGREAEVN